MSSNITRFIEPNNADYYTALEELNSGQKRSHWIWYIFPQLRGLGQSYMSYYYGMSDLNEAKDFLAHDILGNRLKKLCCVLLRLERLTVEEIFGYVDAMKVKSCMTLFDIVSPNDVFEEVLIKFYNGEKCEKTLQILKESFVN